MRPSVKLCLKNFTAFWDPNDLSKAVLENLSFTV